MRRLYSSASRAEQEDAIMKAAAEEIALVGVRRANMDVVAKQAGVSRSTLYRRFPSRDALITELGRRTFDWAMCRLRTVAMDSGPQDAAIAAFCEGLRVLTTVPIMRRFIQPDADVLAVSELLDEAPALLADASKSMAKALRAAGATMPDADLVAVCDIHIRLVCSLAQAPTKVLDIGDDAAVRRYACNYLAPLIH